MAPQLCAPRVVCAPTSPAYDRASWHPPHPCSPLLPHPFSPSFRVARDVQGAKGPDSPWANLPIELAESHPEAAKFLTRKDKNGFQCNFELATHKLRVHHIKSLDAKAKMDGTPPQDKGRYLGFKAKYEKALIDERGYHECVQELMPDVLYSFQKDLEAHRLPSKAQVAKDEAAISELMKNVQNSGRSMSDDEKYAESLHRQIAKGHAFDPFPELKQKTGREQFTAFNSDGQ